MAHFIVCGMGQSGYRIVNLLLRLGERVTVVAQEARDEWHGRTALQLRADQEIEILMRRQPGAHAFTVSRHDLPLERDEWVLALVWRKLIHQDAP